VWLCWSSRAVEDDARTANHRPDDHENEDEKDRTELFELGTG